ncbi:hypothetical protein GO003_010445 [Methylicorpusculum oleiharenae]|uniref:hypothetical protein n=1 Tax=Methylicorpusculum oleiharenae TaxID=1338687 RepID=UPI00135779BC|nr:hypothetical protein [Methylicorpusculum oleiharenae]MCD2450809.1 hypothetical protein [Methylicorpusculum oleiharenae]
MTGIDIKAENLSTGYQAARPTSAVYNAPFAATSPASGSIQINGLSTRFVAI